MGFGPSGAHAATVDTFDFSVGGWASPLSDDGTYQLGDPIPSAVLTGSFTGTVEPSGFIELGDLDIAGGLPLASVAATCVGAAVPFDRNCSIAFGSLFLCARNQWRCLC